MGWLPLRSCGSAFPPRIPYGRIALRPCGFSPNLWYTRAMRRSQYAMPFRILVTLCLALLCAGRIAAAQEQPEDPVPVHLLAPGETLAQVARRYGVDMVALVQLNPLDSGAPLLAGRTLRLPTALAGAALLPDDPTTRARLVVGLRAVVAGRIAAAETHARRGPGRAYDSMGTMDAGAVVLPQARYQDWVRVTLPSGRTGWLRADLAIWPASTIDSLPVAEEIPPLPARWVWPTSGDLTSPFGTRRIPYRSFHNGIDIANRSGTPIRAARAGTVTEAGWCGGYGYCVRIRHSAGFGSVYGHLLRQPNVSRGDVVAASDRIGAMGSTYGRGGYSTGVHLHFTVLLDGKAVNPLKYLP